MAHLYKQLPHSAPKICYKSKLPILSVCTEEETCCATAAASRQFRIIACVNFHNMAHCHLLEGREKVWIGTDL